MTPHQARRPNTGATPQHTTQARSRRLVDTLLSAATVCAAGIALFSFRAPVFAPFLYAPQSVYRFPDAREGDRVRQTFLVRNVHPWPVTVTGAKGSCGCTQAFPNRKIPFRLLPLEAVAVNILLDTDGKHGKVSQTVHVTTSDNPVGTPLVMEGNVLPSTSPVPAPSFGTNDRAATARPVAVAAPALTKG